MSTAPAGDWDYWGDWNKYTVPTVPDYSKNWVLDLSSLDTGRYILYDEGMDTYFMSEEEDSDTYYGTWDRDPDNAHIFDSITEIVRVVVGDTLRTTEAGFGSTTYKVFRAKETKVTKVEPGEEV